MNITLVIGDLSGGGAERVICNLGNFLSRNHNVTIITLTNKDTDYYLNKKIKRISLYYEYENNNKIKKNLKRILRFRNYIINDSKTDVYVVMLPYPTVLLLSHKKYTDAPIIAAERADPKRRYKKSILSRVIIKKIYSKADKFIFQTNDAQKFYDSIMDIDGYVIPNAIDKKFIGKSFKGEKEKTIVSVGRLVSQKNFELLIKSFYKINKKFPEYKLKIYGKGPLKNDLKCLINELGLENRVFLEGYKSDIEKHIQNASIFVLSSNYEGMPNALIEAMALGVPSISTNCPVGGPKYLIKDGVNGYLVPINDSEKLAEKMDKILSDKKLAKKISLSSKRITEKLDPHIIYKKWEKVIVESNINNK